MRWRVPPKTWTSRTPGTARSSSAIDEAASAAPRLVSAKTAFGRSPASVDGQTSSDAPAGSVRRSAATSVARRAAFNSASTPRRKRMTINAESPPTSPRVATTSPRERIADSSGNTKRRVISIVFMDILRAEQRNIRAPALRK